MRPVKQEAKVVGQGPGAASTDTRKACILGNPESRAAGGHRAAGGQAELVDADPPSHVQAHGEEFYAAGKLALSLAKRLKSVTDRLLVLNAQHTHLLVQLQRASVNKHELYAELGSVSARIGRLRSRRDSQQALLETAQEGIAKGGSEDDLQKFQEIIDKAATAVAELEAQVSRLTPTEESAGTMLCHDNMPEMT